MIFQKLVKKFYTAESSREEGTLANFKALLHRKNVNGQVKSSTGYEPHRDFVFSVVRYVFEMGSFKMYVSVKVAFSIKHITQNICSL